MLVTTHQTARCHNPEGHTSNLHCGETSVFVSQIFSVASCFLNHHHHELVGQVIRAGSCESQDGVGLSVIILFILNVIIVILVRECQP
jgi:hypothetical protein